MLIGNAAAATAVDGAHTAAPVSLGLTLVFAAVLAGLVLCLALEEKLHARKSVIAGVFALVSLLLGAFAGLLPFCSWKVCSPTSAACSR